MSETDKRSVLQPTLWRTARVLASTVRLNCLRGVVTWPGMCVEEIAEANKIDATLASKSLRALQSRGLISAQQESRWVRYFPYTDLQVISAAPVLACMVEVLRAETSNEQIIHQVTAFTHPRRLILLRHLYKHSPIDKLILAYTCSISLPALYRHLEKLEKRALVATTESVVTLLPIPPGISETFMSLIINQAGNTALPSANEVQLP